MSALSQTNLRLHGDGRAGRAGHWWCATDPTGEQRGALRLDPAAVGAAGAVDRVVSLAVTLRRRQLPGLLPILDLVSEAGQVWLLTSIPADPTVADLVAGSRLPATAAPTVLREVGQALLGLHQAGLVHGALGPDTVVVDGAGQIWLAEAGLVPALRGSTVAPAADALGWATLARALATGQAGPAADLLHRCAAAAEAAGLAAGLNTLAAGLAAPGHGTPTVAAPRSGPGTPGVAASPAAAGPSAYDAPTQLGRDRAGGAAAGPHPAAGQPRPAEPAGGRELRFGPGVAAARPPAWQSAPPRRRGRRLRAVLGGLLTLAIVAAVGGYLWWQRQNPLAVTAATVAPAEPPGDQCDVTVDVVGTVQTNGRPGTITYQWIRSDGETSGVLDQTVAAGAASVQVHLFWSFSGQGRYDATATLQILAPSPMEASGGFTYDCS